MASGDGRWWHAVYTRARHEKQVNARLAKRGIETFLPLVPVLSRWKDRRKLVHKPLFPGYLFTHVGRESVASVARTLGVVHVVGADFGQPAIVSEEAMDSLQGLLSSHLPVDPYPYLREGQTVVIRQGPLKGVEGILVRRDGVHKLVVSLHFLGRSVATSVAAEDVEGL